MKTGTREVDAGTVTFLRKKVTTETVNQPVPNPS